MIKKDINTLEKKVEQLKKEKEILNYYLNISSFLKKLVKGLNELMEQAVNINFNEPSSGEDFIKQVNNLTISIDPGFIFPSSFKGKNLTFNELFNLCESIIKQLKGVKLKLTKFNPFDALIDRDYKSEEVTLKINKEYINKSLKSLENKLKEAKRFYEEIMNKSLKSIMEKENKRIKDKLEEENRKYLEKLKEFAQQLEEDNQRIIKSLLKN